MTIFTKYNLFCSAKKPGQLALKEYAQIPYMMDILCRQRLNHLLLTRYSSEKIPFAIMESLVARLSGGHGAKTWQDARFIYFDVTRFLLSDEKLTTIADDFQTLYEDVRLTGKKMIFILNQPEPLLSDDGQTPAGLLGKLLKSTLLNEQWRLIVLTQKPIHSWDYFTTIELIEPTDTELLNILKSYRTELEQFHQVMITDEIFSSAISMTNHYLSGTGSLDKAFELLDSAAARVASSTQYETSTHHPIVTSLHLAQVVSSWTNIPLTHLQHNKFQANKFIEAAHQVIFGQDNAIQMIGSLLQNACIKLHKKQGTLCPFLLAGPPGVGKATLVHAMAEHLFGHSHALFRIYGNESHLENIKIVVGGQKEHSMHLLSAVQKTPYALLFIENIEQKPPQFMIIFKEMMANGYVFDSQGKKYDLTNVIIIATTTVVADYLHHLTQKTLQEKSKSIDLMHLISNQNVHDLSHHPYSSSQEAREEIVSILADHFSADFLQYFNIIPFLPLDYTTLEKIMRAKLKALATRLEMSFGIELNYAPEVIQFLAHGALQAHVKNKAIDKLLDQQLYACVAHELVARIDEKHKPKVLSLRLNENGQLLRCEMIAMNEAELYQI